MKKNFLVTTNLINTWEFDENNFLLGKWCEFPENNNSAKEQYKIKSNKEIDIYSIKHHWENNEKQIKDYEYLKKTLEQLLEIVSEKLSKTHNIKEDKEYWRVVIFIWFERYTTTIFDRWESIKEFFEKNKDKKIYTNFISLCDADYTPKDLGGALEVYQKDEWNHIVFLRILNFLKPQNLLLVDKKNNIKKKKKTRKNKKLILSISIARLFDKLIAKFAFKFNKIILINFYFPKKEYLKICSKNRLIPSKYSNLFNYDINKDIFSEKNKRAKFKDLLLNTKSQDQFIQFLLINLYKDIPKSYIENYESIKKKFLPLVKRKKIIFSVHAFSNNDSFNIYLAETKKKGSKFIYIWHGGGLTLKMDQTFGLYEKISDRIVSWDQTTKNNIYAYLSPALPIIKFNKKKVGEYCTIVFNEPEKYINKFKTGPLFNQSIDFFYSIADFVNSLDVEIKSKVKFRVKINRSFNSDFFFSETFGEKKIDKISIKNHFIKTIQNSKLIIATYPQTAFCEAMYANIPTILIINKNYWQFSKEGLHTFKVLKDNKIAFDDFNEAKIHINKNWQNINLWWKNEDVQAARKKYLVNFFNVKSNWHNEWSDFIHSQSL